MFPHSIVRRRSGGPGAIPPGTYATPQDVADAVAAVPRSGFMILRTSYADGVAANPDGWVPFDIIERDKSAGIIAVSDPSGAAGNTTANSAIKNVSASFVMLDFAVTALVTLNPADNIPLVDYVNDYNIVQIDGQRAGYDGYYGYYDGIDRATLNIPRRTVLEPGGGLYIITEPIAMMQVMVSAFLVS